MIRFVISISICLICLHVHSQSTSGETIGIKQPAEETKQLPESLSGSKSKVWHNQEYQIRLFIPVDWTVNILSGREILSCSSPKKHKFAIRAFNMRFQGTLEEIRERLRFSFSYDYPDYDYLTSNVRKIGKHPVADVKFSTTIDSDSAFYRVLFLHGNGKSFIVTCLYSAKAEKEFESLIDDVLSTVTFD